MHPTTSGPARLSRVLARRSGTAATGSSKARSIGVLLALTCTLSAVAVTSTNVTASAAPKAAAHLPTKVPKAPPNPTDKQIKAAAAAKSQAASDVGRLSGLIAGIDGRISTLNNLSELAGEKFDEAQWNLQLAQKAATKAQNGVQVAESNYSKARTKFRLYIAAAYMNRSGDSSGLLTAPNPNYLLERAALGSYAAGHQIDALGTLTRATVGRANAVSTAKTAVQTKTRLTGVAKAAQIAANRAVENARVQRVILIAQKGSYERQLTAAGEALTGLKNKRAAYQAWIVLQARIRAAAARRAAIARAKMLAAQARERARLARAAAVRLAQQRADDRAAARRRAQNQSAGTASGSSHSSSSSDNNSGSSSGSSSGFGSSNGNWSSSKGLAAVHRAERYLGTNYSFDAGGYYGPSYGYCGVGIESNACHVWGFDCSGLAMYAWSPAGIFMPHYAASQYNYGNVHPSVDQLQPGDLTFWSSDGTQAGIHHVAIYVGNGNVIEAPHTGSVVKIVPLWFSGYYGAVRPGS